MTLRPTCLERSRKLAEFAETCELNTVEDNGSRIGVITSGVSYVYSKDALGDKVNYLKLGMVYPLPEKLIKDFAASVDTLYVVEELDGFIAHSETNAFRGRRRHRIQDLH